MGRQRSLRSKAAHFVSDLTTVFLNPISDKPSKPPQSPEIASEPTTKSSLEPITEKGAVGLEVDGPDTSSFAAFMYSLLSSSEDRVNNIKPNRQDGCRAEMGESSCEPVVKENVGKKSLFSKGKHSLGRAIYHVARIGVVRSQGVERKGDHDVTIDEKRDSAFVEEELKVMSSSVETLPWENIPDTSEPSLLISEKTRGSLYASLPALVQGRKWVLLYSTWRHGISLSTLYRRSMLWPGLSLLVIGDRKGAVFGGLVEAPLKPTSQRKYQGTNNTFVFTNNPGYPIVYRPTGANRYFTLCSTDFLAMGGGGHFALYLDADLLSGSSSVSETYGNSCLAQTEDFEVKEVELWGFVYASQYEEVIALTRKEAPGICRW